MDAFLTPWSVKHFFRRYIGQIASQVHGMTAANRRTLGVLTGVQEPQARGCPLGRPLLVIPGIDPYRASDWDEQAI